MIGGGITGLVAARSLRMERPDVQVVVLERDDRLGGKILTQEIAGVPVEAGADWFITRQPAALELCRELGLGDELVPPKRSGAYVWMRKKLRKLPPGLVRGLPLHPSVALRAGLLSPAGALRVATEALNKRPLTGPDVSVGEFVRTRFGDEVMEQLVDPMLAASRSGRADEMSLAAAAPEIDSIARSNPSVLRGLRGLRRAAGGPPPSTPFLGVRGGMTRLIDTLAGNLQGAEVRTGTSVDSIQRRGEGWIVRTADEEIGASAVIAAVPAFAAADLLQHAGDGLATDLRAIRYAAALVATLVYPPGAGPPPAEGSGLLVPTRERRLLTAAAWFSEKWEHARPADGSLVLRCFVGKPEAADMSDEDLERALAGEARTMLGLGGPPVESRITRWSAALPVYRVGHLQLVDRIESQLAELPGLVLAGAGYRGSGLPDCIAQGQRAAEAIAQRLAANQS